MIWRKEQPPAQDVNKQRGFDDYELRLGDILRGERATLGKSLLDVQRELHIRAAYIAAIENGDLDAFEAPSFVAGFVRSYARYLGMDTEWVYQRFCLEHDFAIGHGMNAMGSAAPRPQREARAAEPRTGALRGVGILPDPEPFWKRIEPGALGSVTVLAALVLGLGFAGWTVLKEVQRVQVAPADIIPNVVTDFDPLTAGQDGLSALDTDPFAVTAEAGAEGRVRIVRPQALDIPVLVPRDGPIATINPREQGSPDGIRTDAAIAEAMAAALGAEDAPRVLQSGPPVVEILAVRPSWMRVRAADGSVIFERILDSGERYTLPQTEQPPTLHAGNSGSVYFLIDGEAYGPAAPGANVARNIALSAEALREGFSLADLSRDSDLAVMVARLREQ
ncbi:MAG: helix-turn-helix domain-containing protein [Pararhodobacter sp.]